MAYIGKSPDGTGVRSRFYYTQSSGGGTSVSGSSDDGTSLAFSDGAYVDVFLNGVLLVAGTDYNTNTANTIAGLAALANGDVVEVVVYDIFTVADTVSALNGGTFAGNVNFSGNIDVDGTTTVDGLTSSEALDVTTSTHANASVFKSTGTTQLFLQDTDATSDDQFWGFQVSGGSLNILTCDDDRSGGFLTPIELTSTGVISHSISASGDIAKFVTSANSGTGLFLNSQTSNQIDVVGFDGSAANAVNIRAGGASGSGLNVDTNNNVGINASSGGARLHVEESADDQVGFFHNTNSNFSSTNVQISTSRNTTGGAYNHLACSIHGVAVKFNVFDSGNVANTNNSYGQISDQRMKENIADASSQWNDIKALQVRKFNLIGDDLTQIGVVAQEVEAAGMNGLIEETAWFDAAANPDSEVRKTVKYSVLYMKAVKALQEAMTRIETLETKVAALEAGE